MVHRPDTVGPTRGVRPTLGWDPESLWDSGGTEAVVFGRGRCQGRVGFPGMAKLQPGAMPRAIPFWPRWGPPAGPLAKSFATKKAILRQDLQDGQDAGVGSVRALGSPSAMASGPPPSYLSTPQRGAMGQPRASAWA